MAAQGQGWLANFCQHFAVLRGSYASWIWRNHKHPWCISMYNWSQIQRYQNWINHGGNPIAPVSIVTVSQKKSVMVGPYSGRSFIATYCGSTNSGETASRRVGLLALYKLARLVGGRRSLIGVHVIDMAGSRKLSLIVSSTSNQKQEILWPIRFKSSHCGRVLNPIQGRGGHIVPPPQVNFLKYLKNA